MLKTLRNANTLEKEKFKIPRRVQEVTPKS